MNMGTTWLSLRKLRHAFLISLWPDNTWRHRSGSALALVCLGASQHQTIAWANADISLVRSCGIHLRTLSRRLPKQIHSVMSLKVTILKLLLQLPGNNELNHQCQSDGHQTQIWSIFFMYSEFLLDYRVTRYDITTHLAVILTLYLPRSASWLTSVTSDVTCIYHIIMGKLVLCLNDQLHCTWDLKRAPHAWPIYKGEVWGFRLREAEQIVYIHVACVVLLTLLWRHNGRDSVSDHQPHDCLFNPLIRRRSKKTPKLRVTGLCARNSPGTGEFPAQMASNVENVSIWWRHHGTEPDVYQSQ